MPIVKKMKMGTQPKSSASSQPAKPYRPRKEDTKTKLVSFDVDLADLPPLSDAQKAELAALEALPDEDIDTSDMDVNLSRFDHKSCVPERCRSYHRVWWALHGWGITNGWRLRCVHEGRGRGDVRRRTAVMR